MDTGLALLLVTTLLSWGNLAVHHYTHFGTYALFPAVAAAGGTGFVDYHRAYERRLPVTVYGPWAALVLASGALVLARPDGVPVGWAVLLLALNLSIAGLSLAFAAPVHRRIDRRGHLEDADVRALLRWNGVRLLVAALSAATATALLWVSL